MNRNNLLHVLAAAGGVFALSSCSSGTHDMQASHSVPAAAGEVKAKEGKNGNTDLSVKVEHLARPGLVEPDTNTYVVWAKDENSGQVTNLGALKVDKNLNGRLTTVTPYKNFDLFITPESQSAATSPSGEHLLWTRVNVE